MAIKFTDQILVNKTHLIHKIKAKDISGQDVYYFVLIEENQRRKLVYDINRGVANINFEDYGIVIASSYEIEPSNEIKQLLKEKYGLADKDILY